VSELARALEETARFVRRYVVLTDSQLWTVALWVSHTHAFDAAEATPYLSITSAEKASGKTRLLETLEPIVAQPWFTGRVTAAVLVRKVDTVRPTLLLDESDAAFGGEREYAEALRGILNSGYRRNGVTSLCVRRGGDWEFVDYSGFCPKAFAGIGELPDTIASRSIPIRLRRRAPGESTERFRAREVREAGEPIRTGLEAWAPSAVERLAAARPAIPDALADRAADVWEPLLAISDLAGGEWPSRARRAATELSAGADAEDPSAGVRLLADIRALFRGTDRLASAVLVARLNALDESPWGEWSKGRGLTQNKLARLLRDFEIRSRSIRLEDGATPKGYLRGQFLDAWNRYLPPKPHGGNATAPQAASEAVIRADSNRNGTAPVAAPVEPEISHEPVDVAAVAVLRTDLETDRPESAELIQSGSGA
jgi:hypothetical protein